MNRGKADHKYWVHAIADQWRMYACEVFVEHYMKTGRLPTFPDVLVVLQGYKIAVEIEFSLRHVLVNSTRDLEVGCDEVHLLFPTARLRDAARRKLRRHLSVGQTNRIAFLLLRAYRPNTYRQNNRFLRGKRPDQKTKKSENGIEEGDE